MFALTSRRVWAVAAALVLAVLIAGCGGAPTDDGQSEAASDEGADEGPFPVSVEHKYGTTEITEKPERIVTVGLTDHDTVLALGSTPVALTCWFGDQPNCVWPWAQDELGDADPVTLQSGEIDFEKVAAQNPDLILGVNSDLSQDEYDRLSQTAPTVAQSDDYVAFGTPWQEQTRTIGKALGRSDRAEELISDVEAQFAAARENTPEFNGKTAVIALTGKGGNYYPYGPQDNRARFMKSLGFELKPKIAELAGDKFFATISTERLSLLNADVLVWIAQTQEQAEALRQNAVYQQQSVVKEGRDVFVSQNHELGGALSYNNVLSLQFAIEEIVGLLQAAVDGDPATEVPAKTAPTS